jgi:hypothetical protein
LTLEATGREEVGEVKEVKEVDEAGIRDSVYPNTQYPNTQLLPLRGMTK